MQYTSNFSLRKPQLLEPASILDINHNADAIDTLLYQNRRISSAEYDQNASYVAGDLVVYNNLFYRCTAATSGNWDSTKWVRTTLASEVISARASGGSDVEGNPAGTATEQLEKLKIDNDIFSINDASKIIADKYDDTATYAVGDYCIYHTLLYKCITVVSTAEPFDNTKWTACLVTDEMGQGGNNANQNIADEFSASSTYAVGDYVIYQGLLYKCTTAISTAGAWDGSKWTSCVVTDEMGQGGGGSSTLAGLSDVNLTAPSQGDILTYDGSEWVNGEGIGGGGGMYIDVNTVIQAFVNITDTQAHTYTATQDCAIVYNCACAANASTYLLIDGVDIGGFYDQSVHTGKGLIYLKKGQVFSYQGTATSGTTGYTVYGITYTTQKLQPVIYSEKEREIGVWTDAKPLYQKTIYLAQTTSTEDPLIADISGLSIDTVVYCNGLCRNISNYIIPLPYAHYVNQYDMTLLINNLKTRLELRLGSGNRPAYDVYVTIQYTKTTDTVGSGIWTPQGVPAVHYSTAEQIVGTWIDGSTIYERTYTGLSVGTNGTSWVQIAAIDTSGMSDIIDCVAFTNTPTGTLRIALAEYVSTGSVLQVTVCNSVFNRTINTIVLRYIKSS